MNIGKNWKFPIWYSPPIKLFSVMLLNKAPPNWMIQSSAETINNRKIHRTEAILFPKSDTTLLAAAAADGAFFFVCQIISISADLFPFYKHTVSMIRPVGFSADPKIEFEFGFGYWSFFFLCGKMYKGCQMKAQRAFAIEPVSRKDWWSFFVNPKCNQSRGL